MAEGPTENAVHKLTPSQAITSSNMTANVPTNNQTKERSRRRRRNKKKTQSKDKEPESHRNASQKKHNSATNHRKRPTKNEKKHNWWRQQLPKDAVDPITLDPLVSLNYPPFALVASEPYEPTGWPPTQKKNPPDETLTEEERQRRILEEQWGKQLQSNKEQDAIQPDSKRHVNLFDG